MFKILIIKKKQIKNKLKIKKTNNEQLKKKKMDFVNATINEFISFYNNLSHPTQEAVYLSIFNLVFLISFLTRQSFGLCSGFILQ